MKYFIKNMVSDRCKIIIKTELENLEIKYSLISLGEVEVIEKISSETYKVLQSNLRKSGYDLIRDKKLILIEKIKITIIEMVHNNPQLPNINFSTYLSDKLNYQYTYMANVFSEVHGTTIEHYIIMQKIERIKAMIEHENLNLKEIAFIMKYSSVGHLSNQFKKITGLRPADFKRLKQKSPNAHDDI